MIQEKRVLAWIPARGGSKGIKDKNIKPLCGKPLISYTIEAALNSKYVDRVMVSTDSDRIAEVSRQCGAWIPSLRPAELASDTSKTLDAVLYTIELLHSHGEYFDILALLQPTSPLRTAEDIDRSLEEYIKCGCQSIVSVSPVEDPPLLIRSVAEDGRLEPLLQTSSTCRRQDMKPYYAVNGSIYINALNEINADTSFNDNLYPYFMEAERSVDIDSPIDFLIAECLLNAQSKEQTG